MIMSEPTVGYGQIVLALFADLGMRPDTLAIADNIETMKVIVQSGKGIAIVPRACVANEVALGALKALAFTPPRSVTFSLFRRRQPLSHRKEAYLAALRDGLRD
jgi:DNA-binding transcriptional LysR family regulator